MRTAKIKPSRLAIVVSIAAFIAGMSHFRFWDNAADLPITYGRHLHSIDFENYAAENGTTVQQLRQDFYDDLNASYLADKAAGLSDCDYMFNVGNCAEPPFYGTWAVKTELEAAEYIAATERTLKDEWRLFAMPFFSIAMGIFLVFMLPMIVRRLWRWLAPQKNEDGTAV